MPGSLPTIPADPPGARRHRRFAYRITTGLLGALMIVVALDGTGAVDVFGIDTRTALARGEGYTLAVRAASVSRPGLATPLQIRVHRDGGFDEPVELAIDRAYLQHFDVNRMYPESAADRSRGPWVVLEFDPPDGDELIVELDGRLEPAAQTGAPARVAVLDGGDVVAEVSVDLWVWP